MPSMTQHNESLKQTPGVRHVPCMRKGHAGCIDPAEHRG